MDDTSAEVNTPLTDAPGGTSDRHGPRRQPVRLRPRERRRDLRQVQRRKVGLKERVSRIELALGLLPVMAEQLRVVDEDLTRRPIIRVGAERLDLLDGGQGVRGRPHSDCAHELADVPA